jgi:hypothetical protein
LFCRVEIFRKCMEKRREVCARAKLSKKKGKVAREKSPLVVKMPITKLKKGKGGCVVFVWLFIVF